MDDIKKVGLGLLLGILIEKYAPGAVEATGKAVKTTILTPIKVIERCLEEL
ncbi:hypothetical protein TK1363 [Thermococcus kodakarensis KOD1]|uniref:Uncharacterized protein n=1 Tax=Thermococcus kodakarensis (strain ATCC BAA-918 / JCM 12380 / KOD1) TaxID=69014 RepID=Q5JGV9_THEKO|nr:hypothetical protein [Thermococcus kodakarensis]WCN27342.1 hypothetical protein POG15_06925 [Thermococcus kodakarensis]WCN29631.1 hypothetical protein POG21_06920 [Thermococcus kodakarensis]BAD85552.1 hypothetical protein TK1363 [Thermococcus kodakarensis KOD1]